MLNEGAYTAAFVKGGIESVDKGQMEAARSLGLPFGKAMRRVILPQGSRSWSHRLSTSSSLL